MSSRHRLAAALLACLALAPRLAAAEDAAPRRPFLAYHESWFERPATGPAATTLAMVPDYVSIVALAFVKPDLVYAGGLDLAGTGLSYRFPGTVLRDAIRQLKHWSPGTRVVLSVGGSGYAEGWRGYNPQALGQLVRDLDADGVDLDYEAAEAACARDRDTGRIACATDATWRDLVARTRAALPRPFLLTVPAWSTGAFGEGKWRDAPPGGSYTGVMLDLLRSPLAREIDLISIMAYDAGPSFDPVAAYRAYRDVWPGPLALGLPVAPSLHGGPQWDLPQVAQRFAAITGQDPAAGAMLYGLLARQPTAPTAERPDGRGMAQALCRALALPGCEVSLP
jgi:hypothetical protein